MQKIMCMMRYEGAGKWTLNGTRDKHLWKVGREGLKGLPFMVHYVWSFYYGGQEKSSSVKLNYDIIMLLFPNGAFKMHPFSGSYVY